MSDEREEIARVLEIVACDGLDGPRDLDAAIDAILAVTAAGIAQERERCARVAEAEEQECETMRSAYANDAYNWSFWERSRKTASSIAAAIRAGEGEMMDDLNAGDYVLATKYGDGDTGDQYAVGFYHSTYTDAIGKPRYMVVDGEGKQFRGNGFRRIEKITHDEGERLCARFPLPMTEWVGEDDDRRPIGTAWDVLAEVRAAIRAGEASE